MSKGERRSTKACAHQLLSSNPRSCLSSPLRIVTSSVITSGHQETKNFEGYFCPLDRLISGSGTYAMAEIERKHLNIRCYARLPQAVFEATILVREGFPILESRLGLNGCSLFDATGEMPGRRVQGWHRHHSPTRSIYQQTNSNA